MTPNQIKMASDMLEMDKISFDHKKHDLNISMYRLMTNNKSEPIPADIILKLKEAAIYSRVETLRRFRNDNGVRVTIYKLIYRGETLAEMKVK